MNEYSKEYPNDLEVLNKIKSSGTEGCTYEDLFNSLQNYATKNKKRLLFNQAFQT